MFIHINGKEAVDMEDNQVIDITKFDEGPKEIIKYMDYMPDDDEKRMALLMSFMMKCIL